MKQITALDEWIAAGDAVYGDEPMRDRLLRARQQLIDGILSQDMKLDRLDELKREHEEELVRIAEKAAEFKKLKEAYQRMLETADERLKQHAEDINAHT